MEETNDIIPVETSLETIADKIVKSDSEDIQKLVDLFNLNITKKNATRVVTYEHLVDKVLEEMTDRIEKRPSNFDNTDLLNYLKIIQESSSKAVKNLTNNDDSTIKLNQNTLNINIDTGLDRSSKEKVINTIASILQRFKDQEVIEVESESAEIIKKDEEEINEL